ncbi:MAG: hypothetical protein ACOVOT_07135 [Rubrivivax sp.]|jgi:hypothetical protein
MRTLIRRGALVLATAVAACAQGVAAPPAPLPAALAEGVSCDGGALAPGGFIAFAGWRVGAESAWGWAQALAGRSRVAVQGLRCAVRGPQDSRYREEDVNTATLARHLIGLPVAAAGTTSGRIVVVAHSSGAFVAQRWLRQLREQGAPGLALLARIEYHNLDGDIGSGERELDAGLIAAMASVQAVYAVDGAGGESANAAAMRALHALAPQRVRMRVLRAEPGACAPATEPGARWCLHQTLITPRPSRRAGFDVQADYAGAAAGKAQSAWLVD